MPTTKELKAISRVALDDVEAVRRSIHQRRELWEVLCRMPDVNRRWLRAFATGQIRQPPAGKYMALRIVLMQLGAQVSNDSPSRARV
jgi:hypothetical protein